MFSLFISNGISIILKKIKSEIQLFVLINPCNQDQSPPNIDFVTEMHF